MACRILAWPHILVVKRTVAVAVGWGVIFEAIGGGVHLSREESYILIYFFLLFSILYQK